ncbi:hypothetical protein, partial [Rhodobacter capsulatus]|uniref:hypothetical protein n=1 Tax=Rhodobacter capsulatus TaxID=1061 RepID=UPI001BB0611D
ASMEPKPNAAGCAERKLFRDDDFFSSLVNRGWFYRVSEDGVWQREQRDDDCPCGTDWPHERHMASLYIIEDFLADASQFDE